MAILDFRNIDFVGDIHANYKKFVLLLEKLDYRNINNKWQQSNNRKLIILGDFVNVGENNTETLNLIKSLINDNIAFVISGNHEYFLAWYYYKLGREALISAKSPIFKDYATLLFEYRNKIQELEEHIKWILELPLFYENKYFRAVHAYWSDKNINKIRNFKNLKEIFDYLLNNKDKEVRIALNEIIEGLKIQIYQKCKTDKPIKYRIKWWKNIYNNPLPLSIITHKPVKCPGVILTQELLPGFNNYNENEKPVFFGHYWFQTIPYLLKENACCLDFGASKGGYLVSYRWSGELKLLNENILYV